MTVGAFLFFRHQIYYSQGKNKQVVNFEITKGEGNAEIASKLEEQGLISDKLYFYYYVRANKLINKIMPGEYELSGNMTIPEIAQNITSQQEKYVKITFPEGWNSKQMAERLKENGLNGDGFLAIVKDPQNFKKRYSYLQDPKIKTLEGYLFPDTYFFKPDITAENIVGRMLDNFDGKLDSAMRADIAKQNKSIGDIVIMASVVEAEVTSTSDRSVVSGIFWKRIGIDMPIQSDATLTYAMDDGKSRHSYLETRVESPFNTYINKGLPPTPINSPSLEAIEAAIYPKVSDYLYFLSDPKTGTTYFAKTLDEQNINKVKVGL
jgi:UPF0755 protein